MDGNEADRSNQYQKLGQHATTVNPSPKTTTTTNMSNLRSTSDAGGSNEESPNALASLSVDPVDIVIDKLLRFVVLLVVFSIEGFVHSYNYHCHHHCRYRKWPNLATHSFSLYKSNQYFTAFEVVDPESLSICRQPRSKWFF